MCTPRIEDGNNFGVDVQVLVRKKISEDLAWMGNRMASLGNYHNNRGGFIDTLTGVVSTSTTCNDDGGILKKHEQVQGVGRTALFDRKRALAWLDANIYIDAKTNLWELQRRVYIMLDLLSKNQDKLRAPRGDCKYDMTS